MIPKVIDDVLQPESFGVSRYDEIRDESRVKRKHVYRALALDSRASAAEARKLSLVGPQSDMFKQVKRAELGIKIQSNSNDANPGSGQ